MVVRLIQVVGLQLSVTIQEVPKKPPKRYLINEFE